MNICTYQGLQYADCINTPKIQSKISVELVIEKVSERFGLPSDKILSNSRKAELVEARRFCINILRQKTNLTLKEIGGIFNRDHSTIIWAIESHSDLMRFDAKYRAKYKRLFLWSIQVIKQKL